MSARYVAVEGTRVVGIAALPSAAHAVAWISEKHPLARLFLEVSTDPEPEGFVEVVSGGTSRFMPMERSELGTEQDYVFDGPGTGVLKVNPRT